LSSSVAQKKPPATVGGGVGLQGVEKSRELPKPNGSQERGGVRGEDSPIAVRTGDNAETKLTKE